MEPRPSKTSLRTFMPAEDATHVRTLMAWPRLPGVYGRGQSSLNAARREVAAIANAIAEFEPVWLYASPSEAAAAQEAIGENVLVKVAEVDNLWMRDIGPVFVRSASSSAVDAAVDFNFNYWGAKCKPTVDPTFARRILEQDFKGVTRRQAGLISEGGALEVDGEGTLLNRNNMSKEAIEEELKDLLGVRKIIWLTGLSGYESTDWHVDAFARFIAPGHILLSKTPNADAEVLEVYNAALQTFKQSTDAAGRSFRVTTIEEPELDEGLADDDLCSSYVNYLIVNNGIIIPGFGNEQSDRKALGIFRKLFNRPIRQVYINELPKLGGGIHCATQQVPA